jgi:hypothetical protein
MPHPEPEAAASESLRPQGVEASACVSAMIDQCGAGRQPPCATGANGPVARPLRRREPDA